MCSSALAPRSLNRRRYDLSIDGWEDRLNQIRGRHHGCATSPPARLNGSKTDPLRTFALRIQPRLTHWNSRIAVSGAKLLCTLKLFCRPPLDFSLRLIPPAADLINPLSGP